MQNYFIEKSLKNRSLYNTMQHLYGISKIIFMRGLDAVLPPRCPISGDIVDAQGMVSAEIWSGLEFITDPYCMICGIPFEFETKAHRGACLKCLETRPLYDTARSALRYNDASRHMILGFKHGDKTHMAPSFVPWLTKAGADFLKQADVLVPVPLHRIRLLSRRYNQAGIIAQEVARKTGIEHLPMALKRVRATKSQGHLKTDERAKNVCKAFVVRKQYESYLNAKNVVLIDDVFTTGATVKECAKILKKAGAARVDVLTLARVVKD